MASSSSFSASKRFSRVAGNALSLLVVVGVALSLLCLAFLERILFVFGAGDAVMPYAAAYMR